jgi:hypothetical protein
MKIKKSRLVIVRFLIAIFILVPFNSCDKDKDDDNDNNETQISNGISGLWEFTVSADQSYVDTTIVHGLTASDFEESSSTYREVYLYEDENHDVYGEMLGYKIYGKHNNDNVELTFYEYPDGPLDETIGINEMTEFCDMQLSLNSFGFMVGGGDYALDPEQPWTAVDTYTIEARKINDISNPQLKSSFTHILCEIASTFTSFLISSLTDGIFRPMASCYGHKDGGGYYAFGHVGPGSSFPVYTQTVYLAWEWSWCKVRPYGFDINLEGESIGYEALVAEINKMEPILNIFKKLGFDDISYVTSHLAEFHETYGGFALTAAYSTHSHNMSLYVNHEYGSSSDVLNDEMIVLLKDGLDAYCHTISAYAGKYIQDAFHMKRSDVGICNSDIIFFYIIGTNHVSYN